MKYSIRYILPALCLFLSMGVAGAQSEVAMPFLRIVRDPAAGGMGFAGVASSSEVSYSSFRNSAVIPFSGNKADFGLSYQSWAPDGVKSSNLNFGTAFKVGERFGLSIGGTWQGGAKYDLMDASGSVKGTFTPSDKLVNAGFGFLLNDAVSIGANVRIAGQNAADDPVTSTVADVFLMYRIPGLNLAAGVSSIGSSVKASDGKTYSVPSSATFGAAYSKSFSEASGMELALDADYFFCGDFTMALGAQYSYKDKLFARAGYHIGASSAVLPSFLTLGAGVRFSGFRIDLAYLTANDVLGNTISVGLGYSF